jgi:hypothetical protein
VARFDGGVKLGLARFVERIILQRPGGQQAQHDRNANEKCGERAERQLGVLRAFVGEESDEA